MPNPSALTAEKLKINNALLDAEGGGLRVAEVDEDAVAHVLGHEATEPYFELGIDHIILVVKLAHLTQELLELAAAFRAYFALELGQCLVDCLRRGR